MFFTDHDPVRLFAGQCFLKEDRKAGRAWGCALGSALCVPVLDDVLIM